MAWGLSAALSEEDGEWDLWMMWSHVVPKGWEILSTDGSHKPTEYRVYDRIPKRNIWYVGTRKHRMRKRS